ncbi:12781_t:CDS:2, partial [Funneliformis caledonium]
TYDPTLEDSYRGKAVVDGILCAIEVLDIAGQTFRSTFEEIERFQAQILRVKNSDTVPIIFVEEGMSMGRKLGCKYIETSAKTCINVNRSIHTVVRMLREENMKKNKSAKKNKKMASSSKMDGIRSKEPIHLYDYNSFNDVIAIGDEAFGTISSAFSRDHNKLVVLKSVDLKRFTLEQLDNKLKLHFKAKFHDNILGFYGITKKSAVMHLHSNDIVYRDLHSENVLIHDGNIKICDFGIAKFTLDPTIEVSKTLGTILYSDLKYLKDPSKYSRDKKSDIYSIGVLFWGNNNKGNSNKIHKESPNLRSDIIQVIEDLDNVDINDTIEETDKYYNENGENNEFNFNLARHNNNELQSNNLSSLMDISSLMLQTINNLDKQLISLNNPESNQDKQNLNPKQLESLDNSESNQDKQDLNPKRTR